MDIYDFIKNNLKTNSVIFEIGCHMGIDTEKISNIVKTNNYHCFDPDPRNAKIMEERNLNVVYNKIGISDVDGYTDFYLSTGHPNVFFGDKLLDDNDWSASSSIKKPKLHYNWSPWCKFLPPITIRTMRVDTYCKINNINSIDFVWMDVQGAEIEVLKSFGNILQSTKFIYTEYSNLELYEGSPNKEEIMKINEKWKIIHDFGTDILIGTI